MKCPRCGTENMEDDKICKNCGALLSDRATDPGAHGMGASRLSQRRARKPSKFEAAVSALLHAFLYVGLFLGSQLLLIASYMSAYMASLGITVLDNSTREIILQKVMENQVMIMLVSNLITILVASMIQTLRRRSVKREIGLGRINIMRIPTFALYGIALNLFVSCTISVLPISTEILESFDTHYSSLFGGESLFLEIMSIAVVAAIAEEIIFRGILISRLGRGFGKVVAVILSAIIFGLVHGTEIAIVYATVLGLIFGFMYLAYDSIVPSMVCHLFFNLTSYIFADVNIPIQAAYLASAVLIVFFTYRIFFRRPTFSDVLSDVDGKIRGRTAEEQRIFDEVRALTKKEGLTPEDLERMNDEFDRVIKKRNTLKKTKDNQEKDK